MISVIIPCYNAVNVLRQSYDSLPSFDESPGGHALEILMADDGSTDGTGDLITTLSSQDKRIVPVINDWNMGVSATRNRTMKQATGDLIFFMDADDVLLPGALQTLVEQMTPDVDYVRGKHLLWNAEDDSRRANVGEERNFVEVLSITPQSYPQIMAAYSSWNALLRTSILRAQGITFPEELNIGEDRIFNFRYLMACRRISLLNSYTYLWRTAAPDGRQATQVLTKKAAPMFHSIREAIALLSSDWMTQNPAHRAWLATGMHIEMCNNMCTFSTEISNKNLPTEVLEDIQACITQLQPEWIQLEARSIKGRAELYVPLYEQLSLSLGQPPRDEVLRLYFKTLGGLRRAMAEERAAEVEAVVAAPLGLLQKVFEQARQCRSTEELKVEQTLLEQSQLLDPVYYRGQYADVAASGISEVAHFLAYGAAELRAPNEWFDTVAYFERHPNLIRAGMNPLVHYFMTAS